MAEKNNSEKQRPLPDADYDDANHPVRQSRVSAKEDE